jgi:FixJ family two-component response regulator
MTSRRIVVVDDDRHIRDAARVLLAAAGFDVVDLASAADALLLLRREPAAAAIVDFDVARREGVGLAIAVCATSELERVALIGVAFDVGSIHLELVDLAIQKPYATLDLAGLVRSAIEKASRE